MSKIKLEDIAHKYFVEQYTYEEIGNQYNMSKQAVNSRVAKNRAWFNTLAQEYIDNMPTLNEKIRIKRLSMQLSQKEIADNIGTYKAHVCNIENGKVKKSKYIEKICKVLDLAI
tara:strand:+ start:850 stop:1191 length:342 start_codon:yes stop_codon:yes gene_type:complete